MRSKKWLRSLIVSIVLITVLALDIYLMWYKGPGRAEKVMSTTDATASEKNQSANITAEGEPIPDGLVNATVISPITVTFKPEIYAYSNGLSEPGGDITPEQVQLNFKLDGCDEKLSFEIKTADNKVYPTGVINGQDTSIVRIGDTNRFVFERHDQLNKLYIVDFDSRTISNFLSDETDGYTREEFNKIYAHRVFWAVHPNISPDGKLLVYETDRFGYRPDMRVYDFETSKEKTIATGYGTGGQPVIWTGNTNFCFNWLDKTYEVKIGKNESVKCICDDGNMCGGYYPNILFRSGRNRLTWYDCVSGNSVNYDILDNTDISLIACFNKSTEYPATAILQRNNDTLMLTLLRFDTKKPVNIFSVKSVNSGCNLKWINEDTVAVYGTFESSGGTYYIDVSKLLAATLENYESYAAEAEIIFPKPSPVPTVEPTAEPTVPVTPKSTVEPTTGPYVRPVPVGSISTEMAANLGTGLRLDNLLGQLGIPDTVPSGNHICFYIDGDKNRILDLTVSNHSDSQYMSQPYTVRSAVVSDRTGDTMLFEPQPDGHEAADGDVMSNGKNVKVGGVYTEKELKETLGEPLSDEITEEKFGDGFGAFHVRTLKYDGLSVKAYQLLSYPPDAISDRWPVWKISITGDRYTTSRGVCAGMSYRDVITLYNTGEYRWGIDSLEEPKDMTVDSNLMEDACEMHIIFEKEIVISVEVNLYLD